MKKLVSLVVLLMCVSMIGCFQKQDKAVAIVNNVNISSQDYDRNFNRAFNLVQAQNPNISQQGNAKDIIGKRVLQDMILKEVFLQQAKKSSITATQEEIDSIVSKVKEQFKQDKTGKELSEKEQDKAYNNALKEQNLSEKQYINNISDDIILDKYRKALVKENLKSATKEEIKTFFNNIYSIYSNNKKQIEELQKTPGRYEEAAVVANNLKTSLAPKTRFDLILVYADNEMSKEELAQRKALANTIRKEIKDKANFADIAKKYSQLQDSRVYFSQLMTMTEGMQPIELSSKAFKLNVGEISDVFEIFKQDSKENSAQGYFIMNVVEKIAGLKFTYETFEKDLEQYINQKRAESILQQVATKLLKEADIKIIKTFDMDKNLNQENQEEQSNNK